MSASSNGLRVIGLAMLLVLGSIDAARAQAPSTPPPAVQELLRLLDDPAVQAWLRQQRAPHTAPERDAGAENGASANFVAERVARLRAHLATLGDAVPYARDEFSRVAARLGPELRAHGIGWLVLLFATFLGLGIGAQSLYWRLTTDARKRIIALPVDTPADRVRAAGLRLAFGLGWIACFALGSIGAFLIFPWPPLLREIVLTYLLVFLVVRFAIVLGRFLIAPGAPRFRIVPMADAAAKHWSLWLIILLGWFAFARLTVSLLTILGISERTLGLFITIV
ncbi:MAG: mechanosensitive ion channel family protein, partial [Alphaproteobacteria bacterium]|nr:mechanosensitive ion channel family protein [Alphaproteobacteria bacterium]